MIRRALALSVFALFTSALLAQDQRGTVQLVIKLSDQLPSFTNHRLVITLAHNHPQQADRGLTTVASFVNDRFSHEKGKPTEFKVTLGENVKVKSGSYQYLVNLTVFTPASQRTHAGKVDGRDGPFPVLTNGAPGRLTIHVVPAK